jgi:hypothetical protein
VALLREHSSGNRAIDAAAHSDDDFLLSHQHD